MSAFSGQDPAAQDDPAGVVQDIRVGYRVFIEYDQVSGCTVGQARQKQN